MRNFFKQTVKSIVTVSCISLLIPYNITAKEPAVEPNFQVLLKSDIEWKPLNPARGDKGPKAGSLWGDFTGSGPSGFLVKFVDGFSSPPHIHNITYRGIVINGLIHNDDPGAADMWMTMGSFWTQPAGEAHITATKGSNSLAYIEIEEGPYLVLPTEKAFDNGERPVNVENSNIVWLDASNITWIDQSEIRPSVNGPKLAFLWGIPQGDHLNGALVKFPTGYSGKIRGKGAIFQAVVIQGQLQYQIPDETGVETLVPGSYFSSKGELGHQFSCDVSDQCIIYVRTKGKFDVIPLE